MNKIHFRFLSFGFRFTATDCTTMLSREAAKPRSVLNHKKQRLHPDRNAAPQSIDPYATQQPQPQSTKPGLLSLASSHLRVRRFFAPSCLRVLVRVYGGLLGLALFLAGCTVGPNYHPPAMTMPAKWSDPAAVKTPAGASLLSTVSTQPAHLDRWWRRFKDPQLTALIHRALAGNLDLRLAAARVRQARAALQIAAANLGPFVNAAGSYQRSQSSADLFKPPHSTPPGDSYNAGFNGTWELDLFGGIRRSVQAAQASIQAAVDSQHNTQVALVGEVATDYITLRGVQQEIQVARETIVTQEKTVALARQQMGAGFSTQYNVANAEALLASVRAELPGLLIQQRQLIYALGVLLGQSPGVLVKTLSAPGAIPPVPPRVPIGLPSALLLRRPDVRGAERQLAAATAQIGVAVAELFPTLTINGNLGFASQDAADWFDAHSVAWGIGPSVSWAIFSSGAIQANIRQQQALRDQAYLIYRETVLDALQQVENALVAYRQEQAHRVALEKEVVEYRKTMTYAEELYRNGLTDFTNVLLAQNALLGARTALVQSNLAVSNDLVSLYVALGGGWNAPTENSPPAAKARGAVGR
jgi:NodT family efflux transporter outer membrane factor (OMF) lipoprotein